MTFFRVSGKPTPSTLCMNTVWVAVSPLRPSGRASFCITLLLLDTQDSLVIPQSPHSHFWKICISSSLTLSLLLLQLPKLFLCVSGIPRIVRKSSSQCLFHFVLTCCLVAKSCPTLLPWTVASQAPLSMGFPRQKYRSGLPLPSPGDLLDSGIKLPLSFWQIYWLQHCIPCSWLTVTFFITMHIIFLVLSISIKMNLLSVQLLDLLSSKYLILHSSSAIHTHSHIIGPWPHQEFYLLQNLNSKHPNIWPLLLILFILLASSYVFFLHPISLLPLQK